MGTRALRIGTEFVAKAREVVVRVDSEDVAPFALELVILLFAGDPAAELTLLSSKNQKVSLQATRDEATSRAEVHLLSPHRWQFVIGRNQAEYILAFLAQTYRDSVAPVNHIHVEGLLRDSTEFDLTLFFRTHAPPLSAEQARTRLGV